MPNHQNFAAAIKIGQDLCPIFPGPVHQHWAETASDKGFQIIARIEDRYHFAVKCNTCKRLFKTKLFVLMNNQPLCEHCLTDTRKRAAQKAGLEFLRRDPTNRHYAHYKILTCGHEIQRQFELVERVSQGLAGLRCGICHDAAERFEAERAGWFLIGPDPDGDPNYRSYKHGENCGHVQRIARANMQTGRFSCAACSGLWSSEPSYLYLMRFRVSGGVTVLKLGFSRDPKSRLHHQLRGRHDQPCALLQIVPVATGHEAICIEKSLHRYLKRNYPDKVIEPWRYAGVINVKSEIYDISLLPVMEGLLGFVARFGAQHATPDQRLPERLCVTTRCKETYFLC